MALTSAQMISLACQKAKVPGMITQAGQMLNSILLELSQDYDMPINLFTVSITVNSTATPNNGVGPYPLPANYLRAAADEITYVISQIPYLMTQITLAQMDIQINVAGAADFPNRFATDVSLNDNPTPVAYFYPPPNIAIPIQIRYYGTQPDITTPETSSTIPWFPCQSYLNSRLLGELYALNAKQEMASMYLGDGPVGAAGILRRWLQLQGDREMTGQSVILDRRFFGGGGQRFPPSKVTGGI